MKCKPFIYGWSMDKICTILEDESIVLGIPFLSDDPWDGLEFWKFVCLLVGHYIRLSECSIVL